MTVAAVRFPPAPIVSSPPEIGSWAEASYRCGDFPDVLQVRRAGRSRALAATARVNVDAGGRFVAVELIESSGSAGFDRSIKQTVSGWRFAPKVKEGRAQDTLIAFRFDRVPRDGETIVTSVALGGGRDYPLRQRPCNATP
ncbi:MAG: TonB family protein [Luteimonas sp.]